MPGFALVFAALAVTATPALADAAGPERVTGPARVTGGDTLEVAGETFRLFGIDAPESGQTCLWPSREIDCGRIARAALMDLTAGVDVTCRAVGRDPDGAILARCADPHGHDLGRNMVWTGWALADRRAALDYVAAEDAARDAKRGLWKGEFVKPWEWRRGRPSE